MATQSDPRKGPGRTELVDCLIHSLEVLPLQLTRDGAEVAIEELARIIVDRLMDGGYDISRRV